MYFLYTKKIKLYYVYSKNQILPVEIIGMENLVDPMIVLRKYQTINQHTITVYEHKLLQTTYFNHLSEWFQVVLQDSILEFLYEEEDSDQCLYHLVSLY